MFSKEDDGFSFRHTEFEVSMGHPTRGSVYVSEKQMLLLAFDGFFFNHRQN